LFQFLLVEPLGLNILRFVVLQTEDGLKVRFTTVADRQDARLELPKNFNGQELRYV
jgi:hypothetical protein